MVFTIGGLQPNTEYEVRVSAASASGLSLPSVSVVFRTYFAHGKKASATHTWENLVSVPTRY